VGQTALLARRCPITRWKLKTAHPCSGGGRFGICGWLSSGVDSAEVSLAGKIEKQPVSGDQDGVRVTCCGDDEAVGWVGVNLKGQTGTGDSYGWIKCNQSDRWMRQSKIDPELDIAAQGQTPFLHEHGYFPRRNRCNQQFPHLSRGIDEPTCLSAERVISFQQPDQSVRVEQQL